MRQLAITPSGRGRLWLVAVSVVLFGVVGVIAVHVQGGSRPLNIDRAAARIVGAEAPPRSPARRGQARLSPPMAVRAMAWYALPAVVVAAASALALVASLRRDRRAVALCIMGPAMAVLLTEVAVKPLVGRHRGAGLAFPSGHATGAAAVAVVALLLAYRWGGRRALLWLSPAALALPCIMGVALVISQRHYPTDVAGGVAMGAATVVALAAALALPGAAGRAGAESLDAGPGGTTRFTDVTG
jgi:membrane-associated phospholipid phosphatase